MSVRKRTRVSRKGEPYEMWLADYVDASGTRRQKTFKRKTDANRFHDKARVDIIAGTHTPDAETVTVREAAALWLKTCEARELERSSLDQYRRHVDLHIVPFIGAVKLSKLTAAAIRALEDSLREAERSPVMVRKVLTSLAALVEDARERGLVAVNAARDMRARRKVGVDRRADKRQKGKLKVGVDIPSAEEIRKIIANLSARWRPIILTAIFTGLRSSELRGVRWHDVDLKKGRLHVRQRVDQYGVFGPPKSASGERVLPLPPELSRTLRELKLASGGGELVFATSKGTPHSHANVINRGLAPAQVSAGVVDSRGKAKYPSLHALRHFFASWCINAVADGGLGLGPKAVQDLLGHASIAMTLDVYSHLFERQDAAPEIAAAERFLLE